MIETHSKNVKILSNRLLLGFLFQQPELCYSSAGEKVQNTQTQNEIT